MLTHTDFANYNPGIDPYRDEVADIRLSDLQPKDESLPIKLSVLTSTYHRYSQLDRFLETLCRQDWKEFEVLICDDGDEVDLKPIVSKFEPYLRVKMIRRERTYFHVDPSGGFRELFPLAQGEIWAISQPELMLWPTVCRILYTCHFQEWEDETIHYSIGTPPEDYETWVAIKPYFLSPGMQRVVDIVDWHSDMENLKRIPSFMNTEYGLSNRTNAFWEIQRQFPWWFIGSTHRDSGIWLNMQEYLGHASIDFYTLGYRAQHGFVDIVPYKSLICHQDHQRIAVGVAGEVDQMAEAQHINKHGKHI